jgi:elongation factor Ts
MLDKIKELRERTNISLAKCKSALESTNGNIDEAIIILQKQGFNDAVKKASRETKEGIIYSYVHMDKIGVMVEVNSETDFSARSEPFKVFVERVALQIAAMEPKWISKEDVEGEERHIQFIIAKEQAEKAITGKPESVVNKILEGKMNKWYSTVCLLDQESVAVADKTIDNLRTELVAKIGENVVIRRFVRWELGK